LISFWVPTRQEITMIEEIVVQPQPRAWLERSILQPYIGGYAEHLHRGRYSASTKRVYLCCVAHFARWLTTERLGLSAVSEAARASFIGDHLPRCKCPYPVRRLPYEIRAAIARLLEVLRANDAIPSGVDDGDHVGRELAQFDAYMRDVRGLAANTRRQRGQIVGKFLVEQFGHRSIAFAKINSAAVRRFVLGEEKRWSAGTIRVIGGAVGCYLKFRSLSGDQVTQLLQAIPRAACWRLAGLPEVLSDAEIAQLLGSFAQDFPSRKRAYAMVRCLTDLGLRCSEVVNLRLEDVDWQEGTIRLVGTKACRADILPLPPVTGSAIADYLCDERPSTHNRAIFVRHVAPYDTPLDRGVAQRAVLAAYLRCGWQLTRVHTLRHSVASRLLRAGTSMKDIADILRHRSLDTSAIYTKVDMSRLAAVALPWPGSAS
jgi:integrase/recombinase XerD